MNPKTKRERYAHWLRVIFGQKKKMAPPMAAPNSIVILGLERFGDSILTTPLLKILRKSFPDMKLYIVTPGKRAYSFYKYETTITRLFHAKKDFLSCVLFFLFHPADILFNPKDNLSFTFMLMSRILRARHSVGLDFAGHSDHYNAVLTVYNSEHIIKKNLALLDYLSIGYSAQDTLPSIPPMPIDKQVAQFISSVNTNGIVAINISAGSPVRERSKELWLATIEKMKRPCIIFAMPQRYDDKQWLEQSPYVIPSPNTSSFSESERMLQQCVVLISPDTAMIHLGSAVQIPTIGLYLTTHDAQRFAPFGMPHIILFGKQSLDDIDASAIVQAVDTLAPIV